MIRLAEEQDYAEMLQIYQPFVENTVITFDLVPPTLDQFARKIDKIMEEASCLVCEINNQVVGYAYASAYCNKGAYA